MQQQTFHKPYLSIYVFI